MPRHSREHRIQWKRWLLHQQNKTHEPPIFFNTLSTICTSKISGTEGWSKPERLRFKRNALPTEIQSQLLHRLQQYKQPIYLNSKHGQIQPRMSIINHILHLLFSFTSLSTTEFLTHSALTNSIAVGKNDLGSADKSTYTTKTKQNTFTPRTTHV